MSDTNNLLFRGKTHMVTHCKGWRFDSSCVSHIQERISMYDYISEDRVFEDFLAYNALKSHTEYEVFDKIHGWMTVVTQVHLNGTIEMFNDHTGQMMIPH